MARDNKWYKGKIVKKRIQIYKEFYSLVESVESLNDKVEKIKELKEGSGGDSD